MNLYDWCEGEHARLGKGHPTMAEVRAAGWYSNDVWAEPRLNLRRGIVHVAARKIVAVEIRSLATNRVPKGGRHSYRKPVGVPTATKRGEKLLEGRRASSYSVHFIEDL